MKCKKRVVGWCAAAVITLTGTVSAAPSISEPGQDVAPQAPEAAASLENNTPAPEAGAKEVKFTIKNLKLDASELNLDKGELARIVSETVDREITMSDLNATVGKLTVYCRKNGYPAAAAFLPPQESHDGTVIIKIIPGRYGDIKLESIGRLQKTVVDGYTAGLKRGEIIRTGKLETTLYGLSDITGTKAVGMLSPGKEFGTSDLTIKITGDKVSSTVVYAENYGNASTGRYRYGVQESLFNVGGTGGKMNIGALISNGGLHNYYLNYETLVGRGGTTLGVGVSRMDYETGVEKVSGRADTFSLFGGRTLYQLTDSKMRVTYGFDYRKLVQDYDKFLRDRGLDGLIDLDVEKHSHNFHGGIEGYWRQPGTAVTYNVKATIGNLTADSAQAQHQVNDVGSEGSFAKLNSNVTATQALGHRSEVAVKFSGQMASHNLDSSEQFYLGGPSGVRAYPQGAATGDMGLLSTAEFKFYTDVPGLVFSTYYDYGYVKYRHDGLSGSDNLSGWGIGISYTKPNDWFARLDYARRIGLMNGQNGILDEKAKAKGRLWFLLGKIW